MYDEETYLSDVGDDWSMDILATGCLPWLDHRFREFPKGSWRYKNRGQLIVGGLKAAFGFYSGDWKFYAERFRFLRYWSMPGMYEDCHCTLTGDASFTRLDADHGSFRPRPIDDFAMPAGIYAQGATGLTQRRAYEGFSSCVTSRDHVGQYRLDQLRRSYELSAPLTCRNEVLVHYRWLVWRLR